MTKCLNANHSSLFGGRESIIAANQTSSLENLDKQQIRQWLSQHGVILLRNFWLTHSTFTNLVRSSCSRLTLDPARHTGNGYIQKVNEGKDAVNLHQENGSAPCQPHLLFFYCHCMQGLGSPTTICDGEKLWQRLDNSIKHSFLTRRVVFRRIVPSDYWKSYLRHELFAGDNRINVGFEHFDELNTGQTQLNCELLASGDVAMEVTQWAANPGHFSDKLCFCNSLFGPSKYNQKPEITFEDGSALPFEYLQEIQRVADSITEEINWQSGDLVIIDNSRYMHGRRQIMSNNREVFVAMGYF